MNRNERMLELHNKFLADHYGTSVAKMKFETAICTRPGDTDTVISKNDSRKIGIITRHLLDMTCAVSHALILENECYNRINE